MRAWHEAQWAQIAAQWARQPHAWLLYGPRAVGKSEFAQNLAQALLCEHPKPNHRACQSCEGCLLFQAGTHPDFRLLTSEDSAQGLIRVEAIRSMIDFAQLSSSRNARRVVLIDPASSMNESAANALLKILEEPPEAVRFVLVTHQKESILPTLRSRCRRLFLPSPDASDASFSGSLNASPVFHGGVLAESDAQETALREALLDWLIAPRLIALLDWCAQFERQKFPLARALDWLDKWLYDLAAQHIGLPARFYPARQESIVLLSSRICAVELHKFHSNARALSPFGRHTLNVKMQLEALLIDYMGLISRH